MWYVLDVVQKVGAALDFPISSEFIDSCHRMGNRGDPNRVPGIVVKFVRKFDKEELMRKRRLKRNFSTRHMGLKLDAPVYINDSLSPGRKKLFATAREYKKTNGYKYLWIRNGKILLRKNDNDPVLRINSSDDLL